MPLRPARGWLPDLDARRLGAACGLLWLNFPNNPTGAVAPPALYERAAALGARARVRRGLRRGLLRAVVRRRGAGVGAAGARPPQRRRPQHAVQALVDARLPLGVRRRRRRRDRRAQALPAQHGALPQTFVQRAAVAAWERRGPRRRRSAARYRAKRDVLLPALRAAGLEPAGGPGSFFLWLRLAGGDGRPADDEAAALALLDDHGLVAGPRLVPRARRRGPPAPRARAHAGALRRGGAAAGLRARGLAVGVQGGVQAAPAPAARTGLDGAVDAVAPEQQVRGARELAGLDDAPVGQPRPACRP